MRRLLFALPFVTAAACTYDWTVGPPGGSDGGSSSGSSGTSSSGNDGASTADVSSGDCEGFKAQVDLARSRILTCSGTCTQSLTNECGCTIPVVDAQSSGGQAYAAAVAAYKKSGCVPDCSSGCSTVLHQCFGGVCT